MEIVELSIVIRNFIVAIGISIGGLWALWRWSFSEYLRSRKEIPAIDGKLSIETIEMNKSKIFLTLCATWNNRGVDTIYIDTEETRVDVYIIDTDLREGPFEPKKDLGIPIYRIFPYKDMNDFILEPNTHNILQTQYILNSNKIYLFRWKLYKSKKVYKKVFAWTKELGYMHTKYNAVSNTLER